MSIGGALGHGLQADAVQFARNGVVDLARRARIAALDQFAQFVAVPALEWPAAGQQFVQHRAQAIHIRAGIDEMPLPARLLGAHIGQRAGIRWPAAEILVAQGQSEVGDDGPPLRFEQDVTRFDIAMNEPALVGVMERLGGGGHQFGSFPGRYASGAEPIGQRSTRDMLRDEETDSIVGLAKVKNRNDAGHD